MDTSAVMISQKGACLMGRILTALILTMLCITVHGAEREPIITIHGSGWVEIGQIGHSSDTTNYYHQGAPIRRTFGHINAHADLSDNWEGALGIGAAITHESSGRVRESGKLEFHIEPYIQEARFTYFFGGKLTPLLKFTSGYFSYNYNSSVRNLGLYLLRGPVYPGILFSGFETKEISTKVNDLETNARAHILGLNLENNLGSFCHNIILSSEMDLKPVFDYSLAYIAKYHFGKVLTIGSGINFYHLFAIQPSLTDLDNELWEDIETADAAHPWDRKYTFQDTLRADTLTSGMGGDSIVALVDTTILSHRGIKMVGFFNFDLKPLIGWELGPDELEIYGEVGLIGTNSYKGVFGTISERMPIMIGFNFPTFNVLNNLSLEVEWYGAQFRDDYQYIMNNLSPLPASNEKLNRTVNAAGDSIRIARVMYPNEDPYNVNNMVKDNWKWSLHASKVIQNQLRISMQIANDHFRFKNNAADAPIYESVFSTLDDWYGMVKMSYFF